MDKIKIAIIDDHLIFLEGLKLILQNEFDIQYASNNPKDLLSKMESLDIDLLITDVSMPEISGIELVKIVKTKFPKLKILVMSTYKNMFCKKEIDAYLMKDSDSEILIDTIKSVVLENKKIFSEDLDETDGFDFSKSLVSKREREIIKLISEEYNSEEIAEKLFISKHTIEAHRKNIFMKLQVNNIAGLIKKAISLGII